MTEEEREAARRELAELYRRLELAGPLTHQRLILHVRIARVRKRLDALERETKT